MPKKKTNLGLGRGGPGKPRKFIPQRHLPMIEELARKGLMKPQIAQAIGVSADYFYRMGNIYPQILTALARGREAKAEELLPTFFEAAMGGHKTDIREIEENGIVVRKETMERYISPSYKHGEFLMRYWVPEVREMYEKASGSAGGGMVINALFLKYGGGNQGTQSIEGGQAIDTTAKRLPGKQEDE